MKGKNVQLKINYSCSLSDVIRPPFADWVQPLCVTFPKKRAILEIGAPCIVYVRSIMIKMITIKVIFTRVLHHHHHHRAHHRQICTGDYTSFRLNKNKLKFERRIITQISDSITWTSVSNGGVWWWWWRWLVQVHRRHRAVLSSVASFNLRND